MKNGGIKAHLSQVVMPNLPPETQPAFRAAIEKGRLRSMPNSFLPPSTNKTPGLVIMGDAMNMRHPLTGGGMTVAFNDTVLLSSLLDPQNIPHLDNSELVLRQLSKFHWQRKNLTAVINVLAQALYSLFAANGNFNFNFFHETFKYPITQSCTYILSNLTASLNCYKI